MDLVGLVHDRAEQGHAEGEASFPDRAVDRRGHPLLSDSTLLSTAVVIGAKISANPKPITIIAGSTSMKIASTPVRR